MQPGQCQAFLNGVDVGCPTGAVYSRLENGPHLVNFPATEIATVGFAGDFACQPLVGPIKTQVTHAVYPSGRFLAAISMHAFTFR
jgi:hypothetical protein